MSKRVGSNIILNDGKIDFSLRKPWNLLPPKGEIGIWWAMTPETRTFFLQDPFLELNIIKGLLSNEAESGGKK